MKTDATKVMNKPSAAAQAQLEQLDAELVVDYLQSHPDFFSQHPQVLTQLQLKHEAQGSVSLVERQQRVLREKILGLEDEITALMANAQRNEQLFRSYSALYQALLQAKTVAAIEQQLTNTFITQLGLSAFSLKIFSQHPSVSEHQQFSADTHKQLLSRRFTDSDVYLGRLPKAEQQLLFAASAQVESVALLQLQGVGLLALGSRDPLHFQPTMDALLISQLQALLSFLLQQLLTPATGAER